MIHDVHLGNFLYDASIISKTKKYSTLSVFYVICISSY